MAILQIGNVLVKFVLHRLFLFNWHSTRDSINFCIELFLVEEKLLYDTNLHRKMILDL